jgi:hypothetical protein
MVVRVEKKCLHSHTGEAKAGHKTSELLCVLEYERQAEMKP